MYEAIDAWKNFESPLDGFLKAQFFAEVQIQMRNQTRKQNLGFLVAGSHQYVKVTWWIMKLALEIFIDAFRNIL